MRTGRIESDSSIFLSLTSVDLDDIIVLEFSFQVFTTRTTHHAFNSMGLELWRHKLRFDTAV